MLQLHQNNGHQWFSNQNQQIWIKGFAFQGNRLFKEQAFLHLFKEVTTQTNFIELLQSLNGMFAVVLNNSAYTAVATGTVNAFPVFYQLQNDVLEIRDSLALQHPVDNTLASYHSFIAGGFTLNNETLTKSFSKLQANQFLWHDKLSQTTSLMPQFWQPIFPSSQPQLNKSSNALSQVSTAVFERALQRAEGKQLIIPLSGGLDSRFILAKCYQMGIRDMICVTYGRKDGFEFEIAQQVAKKLEVEWHFVEFNQELFELYFTETFQTCQQKHFNFTTLLLEQDWLALYHLKQQNKLPSNSIVFSGFGADVLAGSWIPKKVQWNQLKSFDTNSLATFIIQQPKFFNQTYLQNLPKEKLELIKAAILEYLSNFDIKTKENWLYALHNWGIEHRLSRYHVNSVRVYENLGIDWHLPFFDKAYLNYWANVDWDKKIDKQHYRAFLSKELFGPLDVDFYNNSSLHNRPHDSLLTTIKLKTPQKIKDFIKPFYTSKAQIDVLNFEVLSQMVYQKLSKSTQIRFKQHQTDLNLLESVYLLEAIERYQV